MNKSAPTSGFFRWPVPALIVWAAGWLCYGFLLREDVPTVAAMLLSVLTGFAASAVEARGFEGTFAGAGLGVSGVFVALGRGDATSLGLVAAVGTGLAGLSDARLA